MVTLLFFNNEYDSTMKCKNGHFSRNRPVASNALVIWRKEKPISSKGTAIAGGGGDVDSLLVGSDSAERKKKKTPAVNE